MMSGKLAAAGLLLLVGSALAACAGEGPRLAGPVTDSAYPPGAQQWWVPVSAAPGTAATLLLEGVVYRPEGSGPFPLVTINHGVPRASDTMRTTRPGFQNAARWFVSRGYAVAVVLRPGFGRSDGSFAENVGACDHRNYDASARVVGATEAAIVRYFQTQPFVDPNRVIVVGQSVGGLGALGLAAAPPAGVKAVINFAGGGGSFAPRRICSGSETLVAAAGALGRESKVPELWLYAENDQYFEPALAQQMVAAYRAGSTPPVDFVALPPFGEDGHMTLARAPVEVWTPSVSAFLSRLTPG